ncbi:hypothetical protein CR513_17645, partial [Mucuna pruriens]
LNYGDDGLDGNDSKDGDNGNKGDILDGSLFDIDLESDFDVNIDIEVPHTFVASSPITLLVPVHQHTQVGVETQPPLWNLSPHYTYINWAHLDQEPHFPRLDVLSSRHISELDVGLCFDSKRDMQMIVKQYSMKMHKLFCVLESKSTILLMRCLNNGQGCPWRMITIMPKKTDKWGDNNKLDSKLIYSCIPVNLSIKPYTRRLNKKTIARVFND